MFSNEILQIPKTIKQIIIKKIRWNSPAVPIIGTRIIFIRWTERYWPFRIISEYSSLLHLLVQLIEFDDAGKVIHFEYIARWIVDQTVVEVTDPKYVTACNGITKKRQEKK